ncbi:PhzF family phenazine biosynthesis protein [Tropicimonas marinistellae]|uniref:PhzF family phenazine biosynthesis protein n=1 Tax=Tropicimonas marinistellae TaxID=1739787 RepID=UPI000AD01188|nr:PhzF family phenazine biosynthesis protein [Tropicimonas marinistellae]
MFTCADAWDRVGRQHQPMGPPTMYDALTFHTLDVFTDTPYAGNPLAVVLGADDLDTAQMQTIAREFNLSETIFVMQPRDPENAARVRIFFPTAEIPFAGHPTIGCAVLLAEMRNAAGDFDDHLVLEEEAGPVPVRLTRRGVVTTGEFVAPVLPHRTMSEAPPDLIAAALGIAPSDIGFGAHLPGVYQGGPAFLFVPVSGLDALTAARPMEPGWSALMARAGVDAAYLYSPAGDRRFRARMFSPTAGIPEDPATGSASALLAAALLEAGALPEEETNLRLTQGVEMGRPSDISLTTVVQGGQLAEVRVGGSAVRVSNGTIRVPSRSPS